jgi:hypothetical protein
MVLTSGTAASMDGGAGPLQFFGPLSALNGSERWYVYFYPLPPGKDYEDVRGQLSPEYLQAAGSADRMTVEIRKPGGEQWEVGWVRYIVGRPHIGDLPLTAAITLPDTVEMRSDAEIFDAEGAAKIFISYYETGDIPSGYSMRPVEGYTADGGLVDLSAVTI